MFASYVTSWLTSSYPLYRRGNPQLRVYLPNFWMKLARRHDACAKQGPVHRQLRDDQDGRQAVPGEDLQGEG